MTQQTFEVKTTNMISEDLKFVTPLTGRVATEIYCGDAYSFKIEEVGQPVEDQTVQLAIDSLFAVAKVNRKFDAYIPQFTTIRFTNTGRTMKVEFLTMLIKGVGSMAELTGSAPYFSLTF